MSSKDNDPILAKPRWGFSSSTPTNSLNKYERLKSKEVISALFKEGNAVTKFPIKAFYSTSQEAQPYPAKAGFSAPKRKFKKAPHRNLLKRRMREAYRLNKHALYSNLTASQKQCSILFVYIGSEIADFKTIVEATQHILTKINAQIETNQ